ncbi:MAG TPA: HEAT repeat domain-containing protein [Pirellulales bacterium]|nr:HEAT repeat domain-containing protein [Pirellulales bacterium]
MDDDFAERTWTGHLVRACFWLAALAAAGWWMVHRERPMTAHQRVAVLRDSARPLSARRIAADQLERADAAVVPALVQALRESDALGRELAGLALARLGSKAAGAVDELVVAAEDRDVNVRRQAAAALGRIGAPPGPTIAGLRPALHDSDDSVRTAAFLALGRLEADGVDELAALLSDADADVRRRAAIELGRQGFDADHAVGDLRERLADPDALVRAEVYAALSNLTAIRQDELIAGMKNDPDPLVRRTAVALLARDPDPDLDPFTEAAHDTDRRVRLAALVALSRMGAPPEGGAGYRTASEEVASEPIWGEKAVRAIAALLGSDDDETARNAAHALQHVGPSARQAADALVEHFDDPRENVRACVRAALRKIGRESETRPPQLFAALHADGDTAPALLLWDNSSRLGTGGSTPGVSSEGDYGVTDADMQHVGRLKRLRLLDLMHNPVGDAGLAEISGLHELKQLNLAHTKITSQGLRHLAGLVNLQGLNLDNCGIDDEGLAHLAHLPALRHLSLSGTFITDAGMPHLAGFQQLRTLGLGRTKVTDEGLAHLKGLGSLERISFHSDQFSLAGLAQVTGLTSIETPAKSITDADCESLTALRQLKSLSLINVSLGEAGLASLGKLTSLEQLSLADSSISGAGLEQLRPLTKLRLLWLAGTTVSQHSAHQLAEWLPELQIYPYRIVNVAMPPNEYEVLGLRLTLQDR